MVLPTFLTAADDVPLSFEQLPTLIHAAPTQFVFAISGGGSGALAGLLRTPGASRSVLEATVPYCEAAMTAWLGCRPEEFCSARTARAMAMVAFRRAWQYNRSNPSLAGLACTASLVTDRPKHGPHRAHVALQTEALTAFWSLELLKGRRDRPGEEAVVDRLVLNVIAEASGLETRLPLALLEEEAVEAARATALPAWQHLFLGTRDMIFQGPAEPPAGHVPQAVFPGEFNPLHDGHRRMAQMAAEILGVPVEFEIAITNVDKPPLDYFEIQRRVSQFGREQSLWLTRAARFIEKSRLFPRATFVVGVDTLRRIASPRYYGDDAQVCQAALELIVGRGCRFLVFGRNMGTGFMNLRDLDLPAPLAAACREVPAEQFRADISSTGLRRAGQW